MTEKDLFTPKIYEDWMGNAQREKIAQILRRVKIRKDARVLDVGSGPGFLCEFIKGVVAVDLDVENLRRIKGVRILASGDMLPFTDSSFDAVFCLDTVHLLSSAAELGRVVKKDGKAVITRYCSEYNRTEKLSELKNLVSGWRLLDSFFAGTRDREMSAVVVCARR